MVAKHVRAALRVLRTQVELGRVRLSTSTTCVPHFFVFVSSSVWHGPFVGCGSIGVRFLLNTIRGNTH